jgi:hypothetical protein
MAAQLFANNAKSTLDSSITNVATSLSVVAGHGARFPTITGSDYFLATLCQISGGAEVNFEIVKVTARSTDTFTIVRAQEGTTGLAYNAGDKVELRLTKGTMEGLQVATVPAAAWSIKTTTYTAVTGDYLMANTTSAAFTITLPATPSANHVVNICDYAGKFATNNLTIGRNASKIMSLSEDMVISTNNISITLTYIDSTVGWKIT